MRRWRFVTDSQVMSADEIGAATDEPDAPEVRAMPGAAQALAQATNNAQQVREPGRMARGGLDMPQYAGPRMLGIPGHS